MKLIIAEKPSLGRTIASAIGANSKKDGYMEGNGYIVTWAFGHILALQEVDDYLGEKTKWSDVELPFFPNPFTYKIPDDSGKKKQIKIIKNLLDECDLVINAGDADREGQIIIDNILTELSNTKPTYRLWLPEQTEETIKKEVNQVKNNEDYIQLRNEGLARTYVDWLYGINLTRYITLKTGNLYPVGRVLIPIVEAIYTRDMNISNFKPEKYFMVESDTNNIKLSVKDRKYKIDQLDEAQELANELNQIGGKVIDINNKEIKKQAPKLFSLSTLQSLLSKKHKIKFSESLKVIQELYQKGLITYPRTNTEYLAEAEKDNIKKLINHQNEKKDLKLIFKDSKKIFDDSKIDSHSAITITMKDPADLTEQEELIYNTILKRFLSTFIEEDFIVDEKTIKIAVGEEVFELKGSTIVSEGFNKLEPVSIKNELPDLNVGDIIETEFKAVEKETSPPKKYTEESLSNYLKNPFKDETKESETDDEDYIAMLKGLEIGTEATRTGIIENALKYDYITQKSNTFSITNKGIKLIENLKILSIDLFKDKTVRLQEKLREVYNNQLSIDEMIKIAQDDIRQNVNQNIVMQKEDTRDITGTCPKCGKNVYENSKSFYCEGYKDEDKPCNFSIWKNNKWWTSKGKKVNKTIAKKLLKDKKVLIQDFKSSKKNTTYSAWVILNTNDTKFPCTFELEFNN